MDQYDNFEACKRIRGDELTRNIPVILVTTRGEAPNVERGYASGASEYVTKPIDGNELLAKVKSCLGA